MKIDFNYAKAWEDSSPREDYNEDEDVCASKWCDHVVSVFTENVIDGEVYCSPCFEEIIEEMEEGDE